MEGSGTKPGGIISLGRFVEENYEAIEYDLISSAGIELSDVGRTLSWGALSSFIRNLDNTSALWRSKHPEVEDWGTTLRTNILLADLYDLLAQINFNLVGHFSRQKAKRAEPYPRPWAKAKDKRFGKGALPKDKLREWIKNYSKKGG